MNVKQQATLFCFPHLFIQQFRPIMLYKITVHIIVLLMLMINVAAAAEFDNDNSSLIIISVLTVLLKVVRSVYSVCLPVRPSQW